MTTDLFQNQRSLSPGCWVEGAESIRDVPYAEELGVHGYVRAPNYDNGNGTKQDAAFTVCAFTR